MTQTLTNTLTASTPTLYMALELGGSKWVVASAAGAAGGQKPRVTTITAGDWAAFQMEVAAAKHKHGLAWDAPVRTVYEAGRDGFWVHRQLEADGIVNVIVNASSIRVERQRRRAKTDRLDAQELLANLLRHWNREANVWRLIRIPTKEQEDQRHLSREQKQLGKQKRRVAAQIGAALAAVGIKVKGLTIPALRNTVRALVSQGDDRIGPHLRRSLERMSVQLELLGTQLKEVEKEQEVFLEGTSHTAQVARKLKRVRGIGTTLAVLFATEMFGWRRFENRKEVGAFLGLTATPYSSDGTRREQGISKAGNPHLRAQMIQLAWLWLRYQSDNKLAQQFTTKWGSSSRSKRVGIVALARKLAIALWRWVDFDQPLEGGIVAPDDGVELVR